MTVAPGAPIEADDVIALQDAIADHRLVEKTAVTNKVNNTLANDPHLFATVEANSTYTFEMTLFVNTAASNTPDIKVALAFPASSTVSWGAIGLDVGATSTSGSLAANAWIETVVSGAAINRAATNSGGVMLVIKGRIKVAGTAGTLQLQWAQVTTTAENTSIAAGSFMEIVKLA